MSEIRYLHPDEIECRVAKIFDNGLTLLLYKTARTDMTVLDEAFGIEGWSCDYKEIKGNLFCGITAKGVTKWDCGIESRSDDAGNEKKGEASDAFKRAGTKFGIGRELYTSPKMIWVKASDVQLKEVKGKKTTYDTFSVVKIECVDGKISFLQIKNDRTGKVVYTASKDNQGNKPDQKKDTPEIVALKTALIDYINAEAFEHPENVEAVMKANDIANMKKALETAKAKEAKK